MINDDYIKENDFYLNHVIDYDALPPITPTGNKNETNFL